MRNQFEIQLEALNTALIAMGAMCENAISCAVKSLTTGDEELAKNAISLEREIDQKERDIERLCMKLLLQQQPVARDLRLISSALKMITDMERIGDQAEDISKIVLSSDIAEFKNNIHIHQMADAVSNMVTKSIDAFVTSNLELAAQVKRQDDEVDALFLTLRTDLIELIASNTKFGALALDLYMVVKYLERIGDHAVNITEWVEFAITGKHKEI